MTVLDYILNHAGLREIDALEAAVERRRRDLTASSGIISLDPARAAREMSGAVQRSIDNSMDGVRDTVRNMISDMLQREAPELTSDQMAELMDDWMPDGQTLRNANVPGRNSDKYLGLAHKGLINGIPSDAMQEMVYQFIAYSLGQMSLNDESLLRDSIGDWTSAYWKSFPAQIQSAIRKLLNGEISMGEFDVLLSRLLE